MAQNLFVAQSGGAPKMNLLARGARSLTVLRWYLEAVAFVTTNTFVSMAGAKFRTLTPFLASSFLRIAALLPASPETLAFASSALDSLPRYSGFRSIRPENRAWSETFRLDRSSW